MEQREEKTCPRRDCAEPDHLENSGTTRWPPPGRNVLESARLIRLLFNELASTERGAFTTQRFVYTVQLLNLSERAPAR